MAILTKTSTNIPPFKEGDKLENVYDGSIFVVKATKKQNSCWVMDVEYIKSHTKSKALYIQEDIKDALNRGNFKWI